MRDQGRGNGAFGGLPTIGESASTLCPGGGPRGDCWFQPPNGAVNGALGSSGLAPLGAGASFGTTSKAPRIHGWIRQKYAYLPGGRSGGVVEVPVGLPSEIGSQPSVPESQRPSASG